MTWAGAGTGGTLTGLGRRFKEVNPKCVIVGADPHGSVLGHEKEEDVEGQSFEVEGIGYDFYPTVLGKALLSHITRLAVVAVVAAHEDVNEPRKAMQSSCSALQAPTKNISPQ